MATKYMKKLCLNIIILCPIRRQKPHSHLNTGVRYKVLLNCDRRIIKRWKENAKGLPMAEEECSKKEKLGTRDSEFNGEGVVAIH